MIFVPNSERPFNDESGHLSRKSSFDGVTCRCGRGCSQSLSNFAFSMELDASLSLDNCCRPCSSSFSNDVYLAETTAALSLEGEEHNDQQLAGRNCEDDGAAHNVEGQAGEHSGNGGDDWWAKTGSLRGSLARLEGGNRAKGGGNVISGCDTWEGGSTSSWTHFREGGSGRSFVQTPLPNLSYHRASEDDTA
uniref:Uncharacterized protein n=1 Tax=Hemiselmis andersenii TaxID=464988 RepID=A0A6T8GZC8_HEMAN|mmetsp:Transcript_17156/g.39563  ORF Transcript_17156/g.39563 Transcript_17156/m.39563 type:complete len:192 (-) Transcript_17156:321-896(-)|eukprot:CAMPEP_0114156286 /NCGR_PEP_ID=MMETSP0043_2-20121206/25968_1 /TAXON_ID=464988 /ORGANISM="Hemiselmis andersenii, Strain CCMP644" /LENGTH=191 /DNA_ID=CAMNT_0001251699 /DNA_START=205 /DNA_END=780 /DNA_ORIENTATION=+